MATLRFTILLVAASIFLCTDMQAEPGKTWQPVDPASATLHIKQVDAAQTYAASARPTALLIVQGDRIVASAGDIRRKINVASVRKSLIGALYGIAVAEGRIDPASMLTDLGIDDNAPALSATEKKATVRDLLMSRSGIYHPASHETSDMKRNRPARGSHLPGEFWWYNNWDFNVLGTIYRRRTGEDIFESFARRIAAPIGMQDFSPHDGRYVTEPESIHPAYPFSLSARDAARFGLLFLKRGQWGGRQIVPANWVKDSTATASPTNRGHHGYGYLWWTLPPDVFGPGAAYASGNGGQIIAIVPSKQMVAVQLNEARRRGRTQPFIDLVKRLTAAAP